MHIRQPLHFTTVIICGVLAIASILHAGLAPAADTSSSPTFDIASYEITGNTLLSSEDIALLVAPFTGSARSFDAIQNAVAALQATYLEHGYGSVQVLLPEQELQQGIVRIQVIERKVGSLVTVSGNEMYSAENVLRSVPSLHEGAIPNTRKIARSLKVANENPTKQTAIVFKNRESETDTVDATLRVVDEKPWKAFVTLDNTGSSETGHSRVGAGFQHFNLWDRDHRLTAQFITTSGDLLPGEIFNDVKIFGAAYTIPFYELGDSVDFIAAYSSVDAAVGILQGTLNTAGRVFGVHYNHNFDKQGNYQHKLTAGLDYRASRLKDFEMLNVTATPASLIYGGSWQANSQQFSFSLGGAWNIPMASDGSSEDFINSYAAEDDFSKYLFDLDYLYAFASNWHLHLNLNGQWTKDHMIASEQFGIGGMDSVRGFHERSNSGDTGYRWSVEAITPDFGMHIHDKASLRGVIFYDAAHIEHEDLVIGSNHIDNDSPEINIAGAGAGLRFNFGKSFVGRMDYAVVVDGDKGLNTPNGRKEKGDMHMHISLGWIW